MLASNDEAFLFLLMAGVGGVVIVAMRHRHSERMLRLRVLEEGLRDAKLDAASRQQLITSLNRPESVVGTWGAWLRDNLVPRRVFTSAAWLAMIIGGLIATFGSRYDQTGGIAAASIGLGVLALPLVLRELEGRATRR